MSVYIHTSRSISTVGQSPSVKKAVGQHCISQSTPHHIGAMARNKITFS